MEVSKVIIIFQVSYTYVGEAESLPNAPSPLLYAQDRAATCTEATFLYAERHDGVDDVIVVLLESLDGLLP